MGYKKTAVISDLHGNVEAIEAVMEDIYKVGAQEIVCLGDVVGYGPNPRQMLKWVTEHCRFSLRGNHEEAVIRTPEGFNPKARAACLWTKRQILSPAFPGEENERLWRYMNGTGEMVEEGDVLYVHASPNDPIWEYVMPENAGDPQIMRAVFSRIRRIGFGGHTHLPGIFLPDGRFYHQSQLRGPVGVTKGKFFVNVGSTGQPRDQNPRSCYVIFDGSTVEFRRVPYDHRTTARKISKIRELSPQLAQRLMLGV